MDTAPGYIPDHVQKKAQKIGSPVVNELLIAARRGNTRAVIEQLKVGGADPADILDKNGRNCLQLACLNGHYETAMAILQSNKIAINNTNKRGLTALHDSCTEGHFRITLLLLSMGAYVAARTKDGWTCLMCACSNGHVQIVKILLGSQCDINTTTSIGLTALHIAAWKGQTNVIDVLLRNGCNVRALTNNGKTALDLADEENQQDAIKLLKMAASNELEAHDLRIASLEGQLKVSQEKQLSLKTENKDSLQRLQQKKDLEIEKAKIKLRALDEKVSELQALLKRSMNTPPLVTVDAVNTPPNIAKRGKKKDPEFNSVLKESSSKSSSTNDLTELKDCSPEYSRKKRLSHDKACAERRGSVEKRSITDLVAESMHNPVSMAAIKQEIKADNLTPRIQRKLKSNSNQATLPSLGSDSSLEKSPLLQDSKGSPKNSPKTRPRWTSPLKDSTI